MMKAQTPPETEAVDVPLVVIGTAEVHPLEHSAAGKRVCGNYA